VLRHTQPIISNQSEPGGALSSVHWGGYLKDHCIDVSLDELDHLPPNDNGPLFFHVRQGNKGIFEQPGTFIEVAARCMLADDVATDIFIASMMN